MSCDTIRNQIHDYIDRDLKSAEIEAVERHFEKCLPCRSRFREIEFVRQALAARTPLPKPLRDPMWTNIRRSTRTSRARRRIVGGWESFTTYLERLDRRVLWARLGALPISFALYLLIATQMSPVFPDDFSRVSAPVFVWHPAAVEQEGVTVIEGWQHRSQIDDLIHVAREVPFEDQLSVMADIDDEGKVDIGGVLVYPNSTRLYQAIDRSLRNTQFAPQQSARRIFFNFHKIDVYETAAPVRGSF